MGDRPSVGVYAPSSLEQVDEALLLLECPLPDDGLLYQLERALEAIAQCTLLASRHFAERLEGYPPFGNPCATLEERGPRQPACLLGFLTERGGLRFVGLQTRRVLGFGLPPLLKDRIALLTKFQPQF